MALLDAAALVKERTGTFKGRGPLWDALKDGAIQAVLRRNGTFEPLDPAWWLSVPWWVEPRPRPLWQGDTVFNPDIIWLKRADIDQLWPPASPTLLGPQAPAPVSEPGSLPTAPKNKGGSEAKWDWFEAALEMARLYFVDEDPPRTRPKMNERIADWFVAKYGDHPSPSLIRSHVKRFWEKFAGADN